MLEDWGSDLRHSCEVSLIFFLLVLGNDIVELSEAFVALLASIIESVHFFDLTLKFETFRI